MPEWLFGGRAVDWIDIESIWLYLARLEIRISVKHENDHQGWKVKKFQSIQSKRPKSLKEAERI